MRLIDRKTLKAFSQRYPDSQAALEQWYYLMKQGQYESFEALRQTWPSADKVGRVVVFNIKGNHYRLTASVHFNLQIAYILEVMTHAEYSKETWKKRHDVYAG